ncbi:PIN domain-containing protein [Variovorax sp. LT1R16]|uniref:PIN domain-containing protein n=1 Tax=Variovorax sp. LT1R16 TaxID=3443728 RepID=UPI003F451E6E
MIGLDTNVLVRYLAQDDPKQSAIATRFIETQLDERVPGFISLVVLVELCWVLERIYDVTAAEIGEMVNDLLNTPTFHLQHREAVHEAARQLLTARTTKAQGAGFADRVIAQVALKEGCSSTMSFDRAAVRSAGMTLLT